MVGLAFIKQGGVAWPPCCTSPLPNMLWPRNSQATGLLGGLQVLSGMSGLSVSQRCLGRESTLAAWQHSWGGGAPAAGVFPRVSWLLEKSGLCLPGEL